MIRWSLERGGKDLLHSTEGTLIDLKDFLKVCSFWAGTILLVLVVAACLA